MTSIDMKHRVLIHDTLKSDRAFEWAKSNLELKEWESEVFDNFDCFIHEWMMPTMMSN